MSVQLNPRWHCDRGLDYHRQRANRVGERVDVMKEGEAVRSPVEIDELSLGVYQLV